MLAIEENVVAIEENLVTTLTIYVGRFQLLQQFPQGSTTNVEDAMKSWLKHAPERASGTLKHKKPATSVEDWNEGMFLNGTIIAIVFIGFSQE